ncbi:permease [Escherichia coli]
MALFPQRGLPLMQGADNPFAIPLSAVVGIPLYIRAEAVIPLASVLMTKGMGLGALMALIIGSAGASLTEVILLKSMFRMPMIAAFLTVILGMAILMGYLTQMLFLNRCQQ